mgnify:FL=1
MDLESLQHAKGILERVRLMQRERPLSMAQLWHRERPRTSQRTAFQNLGELVTIICGGNRSGKTAGCAQYAVASALGARHPDAIAWCEANGVSPSDLPDRPGNVWAVALDSGDSREYLRPAVTNFLPPASKWRNQYGYGRSEVRLPNGGRIMFPSVDMGRDGFQGAAVDLVWFDEEPADQAVVNEALMRLVDRQGKCIFSMTPLRGMTWLYDRWINGTPEDAKVHWIHGVDNPHLPEGALARLLKQYGPHERAARARGEWTTLEGRIYSDFQRATHVVPAFQPPSDWPVYFGIDFGTRAPFACVVLALDESDDTLHVVAEHYQSEWTLSQHATKLHELMARYGQPRWIVADPEDRGSRLALSREHDIANVPAKKGKGSVRNGINDVCERLAFDVEGKPHLLVHDTCKHIIHEFESYVWDERGAGESKDQPKPRQKDHALDALRYACSKLSYSDFTVG